MHQNTQAVKMRFKPLRNSSYDISIIFERKKRFRGIVGGNKGVYTPRLYPTTNKKPSKTPCNTVVYIRMYTTIASRLKGVYKPLQRTLRELAKIALFEACSRLNLPISERRSNKWKPY